MDKSNVKHPIQALCFNPSGTQLLAACGLHIVVYNSLTAELMTTLKSHKDSVYCLDYGLDGKRFVSGSADKSVIIWSSKFEGGNPAITFLLKFKAL